MTTSRDVQGGALKKDVWVFVSHVRNDECDELSLGLLGEGKRLAEEFGGAVGAVLLGEGLESLAGSVAHFGADKVFLVDDGKLAKYDTCAYVQVLSRLIRRHAPLAMLFAADSTGTDLAARLAARLRVGLAANCAILHASADELEVTRSVYSSKLYSSVAYRSPPPYLATLEPASIDASTCDTTRTAELFREEANLRPGDVATRIVGFLKADPKSVDLSQAQAIVAGGRGIGGKVDLLEELAELLGASVGGSRVAVDEGWLPFERQIGQTGHTVSPKLYIACGISGAMQHLVGIKDAKTIVAINTDRNAPIFNIADLKVVGDVREVIPAMISSLKESQVGN